MFRAKGLPKHRWDVLETKTHPFPPPKKNRKKNTYNQHVRIPSLRKGYIDAFNRFVCSNGVCCDRKAIGRAFSSGSRLNIPLMLDELFKNHTEGDRGYRTGRVATERRRDCRLREKNKARKK